MKRWLWWGVLALLAGAALLELARGEPGYVLIAWGTTSIEMTLWTAVGLLLALALALWLLAALVRTVSELGGGVRHWLGRRGSRRGSNRTARGLIAFVEGHWAKARRELTKGAAGSDTPLINYLGAARAAHELGDEDDAQHWLRKAEQVAPAGDLAIGLTQARMQLAAGKLEQALATLLRLRKHEPEHPVVLEMLLQTYRGLEDWQQLEALLPELDKHGICDREQLAHLRGQWHRAELTRLGEQQQRQGGDSAPLQDYWQSLPASARKQPELVALYAQWLHWLGADGHAETVLRQTLNKHWQPALVRRYGMVAGEEPAKQQLQAEQWLKERPNDAALHLSLGRLCLRNHLWGQAREYFESAMRLGNDPAAFAELARLLAHLGEHELSTRYYQQGLLLSTEGLPDLPLPKGKA